MEYFTYALFHPDGRVMDTTDGDTEWLVAGLLAYSRKEGVWYVFRDSPAASYWNQVPPHEIPAEHRAYILLNP